MDRPLINITRPVFLSQADLDGRNLDHPGIPQVQRNFSGGDDYAVTCDERTSHEYNITPLVYINSKSEYS